ncbi:MAG: hypothetical protein Q7S36_00080 [Candidatus Liptonbacteria bacterium]|nr:hypothetical protein [Candidatus Liptonbacteria bacterium]
MAETKGNSKSAWKGKLIWSAIILFLVYYGLGAEFTALAATTAIKLAVLAGAVYLAYRVLADSFFSIPPNQAAVMYRKWPGKEKTLTGEVFTEKNSLPALKVCIKLPFIDKPEFRELKQQPYDFGATFIAADDTTVTVDGKMFAVPDFAILNASKMPIYGTTTKEDIEIQLQVFASNKLAAIGGSNTSEIFLKDSATLNQILSGAFRLSGLAHRRHKKDRVWLTVGLTPEEQATQEKKYPVCDVPGCKYGDGDNVKAEELMAFYKSHHAWVDKVLAHEDNDVADHSDAELAHGIDVKLVKINPPRLSEKSQAAKDKINETKSRETAAEKELAYIKKVAEINPEEAVNYASEVFHDSTRVIYSGSLGILGGLIARFAPQSGANQPAPPPAQSPGTGGKQKRGRR